MHKLALFLFNLLVGGGAGGGGVLPWSLAALPELNSLNKSCRCKELPKYVCIFEHKGNTYLYLTNKYLRSSPFYPVETA